ncbi:MMPL family transporter [Streptomyces anulatus]|uniref:MMPL family transporter n=1 Tax=Streptomyces TaxID=1883 RepID=UPI000BFB375E|nr:MMPL family transporter [Streptomyces sp. or3]WTC61094.1 MMPL family transporter [Streptomyces anulatus]WTC75901.1 MMPL family transporter [Streptomyces anulatus]
MRHLPVRMARWSARHAGRAIAGWFAFVVLCLVAGIALGTNEATTKDFWVGEAGRAEATATEGGLERSPTERIMIRARSGELDMAAAGAAAQDVTERMRDLPEVDSVAAPVRSKDGEVLLVSVVLNGPELKGKKNVVPLLEQTAAVGADHPHLVVEETGSPAISKGVNDQRDEDLALSERISLPVTVVTLLIVFGSVIMAGVPLLLALSSIAAAIGLSMVASHVMPDAGVGTNLILLIGLAVGVDYTLFYLKREREERARAGGRLGLEALVELAAATAGRAIVISGLAVIVSTATLYLATDVIFSSLATGTILVVAVAVASSLTVLPALLVVIGRRADRLAPRRAARRARRGKPARGGKPETGRMFGALLRPARTRPALTLCLSVLVMLGLTVPALGLKLIDPGKDTFSRDIPAMRVYDRLTESFPELFVTHEVVTRSTPEQAAQVKRALEDLGRRAQADPLFARAPKEAESTKDAQDATSPENPTNPKGPQNPTNPRTPAISEPTVRTSADGRISVLELSVPHPAPSAEAIESLTRLRQDHIPATVGRLSGVETAVSGDVARGRDYVSHESDKLPLVLGFLLLMTFLMTVWAFRSVVLGAIGVVLNLLSAGASLGLLVLVFQGTWAEGLLAFDSLGAIASRVPLFLVVILFGLSMDYQVFVVSRIQEARQNGMSAREAVLEGINRSAKVVTSAAIVMVTVFGAFVALHLTEMKQMGFCLAVAVLLDAVVIRLMVLPSVLLLLGERAWWPARRPGRTVRAQEPAAAGSPAEVG